MAGAKALLGAGSTLALYGPFSRDGVHTAPSNEDFNQSLKSRNPEWGVRDLVDVAGEARKVGLTLQREIEMPANNLILLFERAAS